MTKKLPRSPEDKIRAGMFKALKRIYFCLRNPKRNNDDISPATINALMTFIEKCSNETKTEEEKELVAAATVLFGELHTKWTLLQEFKKIENDDTDKDQIGKPISDAELLKILRIAPIE